MPESKTIEERFCEAYKLFEGCQRRLEEFTYKERQTVWDKYCEVRDEWLSHIQTIQAVGRFD